MRGRGCREAGARTGEIGQDAAGQGQDPADRGARARRRGAARVRVRVRSCMPRAAPVHWRAAPVREAQGRAAVGRGSAMHVCTGAAPGLAVLSTCAVCVGARACARVRTRRGTGSVKTPFTSARWASSRKPWSSRCAPHTRCAPAGDEGVTRGRAWRALHPVYAPRGPSPGAVRLRLRCDPQEWPHRDVQGGPVHGLLLQGPRVPHAR